MISLFKAQGLVKIRLACSKALLLTISSSNIVTQSNGYIKGDKYFSCYKSRLETQYGKITLITPSNIKHFIQRSSVTY